MKYKTFDHMNCSLAQTLAIIGERWTLLILRDAFFGSCRFNQFERNLGIAKNILSTRLSMLIEEGILERREASEEKRTEYVLTEQGLALQPILLSMTHWGDRYRPNPKGTRVVFVDRQEGRPIQPMTVRSEDGRALSPEEVRATPGPAFDRPLKN
jgi:DNA-binding HxlR family transcriptional regulator